MYPNITRSSDETSANSRYPYIPTPDAQMHPSERKRQQTVRQQLALEAFCRNNGKAERQGKSKAVAANTTPVLRRWFT